MVLHTSLSKRGLCMVINIIKGIITIIFLESGNFVLSHLTNSHFIDYMFFVGMAVTIFIMFFSSSGKFTTEYTDVVTNKTNKILSNKKEQGFKFKPNIYFLISLLYTVIGLIVGVIFYINYLKLNKFN